VSVLCSTADSKATSVGVLGSTVSSRLTSAGK
jgi:hypothetical protein